MSATVQRGFRFEDTIPYDTPESLDELRGPTSGHVRVRPRIDTSPDPIYEVADSGQRWNLYSAVVRDGLASEQAAILNRDLLVRLWVDLNLPARCRAIWETKFPELAETPQSRVS
jgi:hypothetical protein